MLEQTLKELREEGEFTCEVIKSLEKSQKTLQDLISDKDTIIESQKELLRVRSLEKNSKDGATVEKESDEIVKDNRYERQNNDIDFAENWNLNVKT